MSIDLLKLCPPERHPTGVKLGCSRSSFAPKLQLGDYLAATPEPPAAVHRSDFTYDYRLLGNGPDDSVAPGFQGAGDCVDAGIMHGIEHFHRGAKTPLPNFTGRDAVALYSAWTGYTLDDAATDNGSDPAAAFANWQSQGVPLPGGGVDKIAGIIALDPKDPIHWQVAMAEFDICFWAFALPISAQSQNGAVWTVTDPSLTGDAAADSWGGHFVCSPSYDPVRIRVYTWGTSQLVDHSFIAAYAQAAYAVLTPDVLSRKGVSEAGFNYASLHVDFARL